MMGETFFDCQIGVVGIRAVCQKSFMGVCDFEKKMGRKEEVAHTHRHTHKSVYIIYA